MRIRKLNLKNIGPFEDAEIEFKPSGRTQEIHIFTGPNGSGKTTLLQALAIFFGSPPQNVEALLKRMWPNKSSNINAIVENDELNKTLDFNISRTGLINIRDRYIHSYYGAVEFDKLPYLPEIALTNQKENWIPFAYNGYRAVQSIPVNAIQEFEKGSWYTAFSEAIVFDKQKLGKSNSFILNQWIANNISKRALSKEKGNTKEANKYASAIIKLEEVISKIVGYKIELDLKTSPLSLVIKANNTELEFDVLPDGLRSTISWIGDLLMRLDQIDSLRAESTDVNKDLPINEQRIFLFLDEIDVHLHPKWQRNILPVVKDFFINATIFLTTHSPFVVNSVDGAWVYELRVKDGKAFLDEITESKSGNSYQNVLREVFDIDEDFGEQSQTDLGKFYQQRDAILLGNNVDEAAFLKLSKRLALQGIELQNIVIFELKQLSKLKNKAYEI